MSTPPPLDAHLGYLLRAYSNQVSIGFARRLAGEEITVAEWVVLRVLHERSPMAPHELADALGLTRGAISRLSVRLLGKGLLRRESDPNDGRAWRFFLPEEGKALVPRLAALAEENEREFFGCLAPEQREQLESILRTLIAARPSSQVPLD
jgi:DNA-binding MarR family transcriptional regulator